MAGSEEFRHCHFVMERQPDTQSTAASLSRLSYLQTVSMHEMERISTAPLSFSNQNLTVRAIVIVRATALYNTMFAMNGN